MTESGLSDFSHFCPASSLEASLGDPVTTQSAVKSVKLRGPRSSSTTWFTRMSKSNSVETTASTFKEEPAVFHRGRKQSKQHKNSKIRNSLPDERTLLDSETPPLATPPPNIGKGDRNSSPIDEPMLHLLSLQRELEALRGCVSRQRSVFSPPHSPDLSLLEVDTPQPHPPPLVVDEPFHILSDPPLTENVIFPLEEYSVQVEPFYHPSDPLAAVDAHNRPHSDHAHKMKRQGSFEYDHLEIASEEEETAKHVNGVPVAPPSSSGYFVAVQFSEEENCDIKTSTVATLYDENIPSRKSSFVSALEEPHILSSHAASFDPPFLTLQHEKPSPINARSSRLSCSIPERLDSASSLKGDAQSWHSTFKLGGAYYSSRDSCHCPSCCPCGSSLRKLAAASATELKPHYRQASYDLAVSAGGPWSCPLKRYWTHSLGQDTKRVFASPLVSSKIERVHSDGIKDKVLLEKSPQCISTDSTDTVTNVPTVLSSSVPVDSFLLQQEPQVDVMMVPTSCGDPETQSLWSVQSHYSVQSTTTCSSVVLPSCCDRGHVSYNSGVNVNVFKQRLDMMNQWFSEFSDSQRNTLLQKILEQCNCSQMHMLSLQMEPILHQSCPHNCQDLLSWLPHNISFRILSYLDPVSLCHVSRVSHSWHGLANETKLWKGLCLSPTWQMRPSGFNKLMTTFTNSDGIVQWKAMFIEMFRLRRNWLKGYCTVRTFEGHSQGISCVQFDDTRIVSGSWDKTIKVWNRRTNTAWAALTLAGHSGTVRCLHLHGNRLVSGSSDRTIKVWDLATNNVGWIGAACRATMTGHLHTVRCLQADDSKVVSGSYDHTVKVWDLKTGHCTMTLRGHTDAVLCLQFDKTKVISGSKDTTIKLWTLHDGQCRLTLHGHEGAVTCLQFDDSRIISGALDRLIKIWNLITGQCLHTMDWIRSEGHTGVVRHLQADSWKIVSAADDKTLKVWSVRSGERLLTLKSHTDGVTCLQFNDQVIVSGSYDKTVKLWDFSVC